LELGTHASAEAQIAALSDDIAYNNHDLHDGLRAELFSTDELAELPILKDCFARVDRKYPDLNYYRRRHEALRRFYLKDLAPDTVHDVRMAGRMMIQFSPAMWADLKVIRAFLFTRMYRAPVVVDMRVAVTQMVNELFPFFLSNPDELPKQWRKDVADARDETTLARIVSDYIAGMTDRFAIQEHTRLIGGTPVPAGVTDGH